MVENQSVRVDPVYGGIRAVALPRIVRGIDGGGSFQKPLGEAHQGSPASRYSAVLPVFNLGGGGGEEGREGGEEGGREGGGREGGRRGGGEEGREVKIT